LKAVRRSLKRKEKRKKKRMEKPKVKGASMDWERMLVGAGKQDSLAG
jgi:hypothetical protein